MKRFLCFIIIICPLYIFSQQNSLSSIENTWEFVGGEGITASSMDFPSIAFTLSATPYVAYQDKYYSVYSKASVQKFNGSGWEYIGPQGFTSGRVEYTSLAISPTGEPWLAYEDRDNGEKATVMKFNGNNWVYVGAPGFSSGSTGLEKMLFSPAGDPTVGYIGDSGRVFIERYDGINWVQYNMQGFTNITNSSLDMAFSSSGKLFVAFQDYLNSNKTTVMKFNGSDWEMVGTPWCSMPFFYFTSIAVNSLEEPYVPYEDYENAEKLNVLKYEGGNWLTSGNADFSIGEITHAAIAVSSDDIPYVTFYDRGDGTMKVMKLENGVWINVGNPNFSMSLYGELPCIKFDPLGKLYIAYAENSNDKLTVAKYDSPFGINENRKDILHIYPNPATITVSIDLPDSSPEPETIVVSNLAGNKLLEMKTNKTLITIPVEAYPAGMYFVSVISNNSVWLGKFCKI